MCSFRDSILQGQHDLLPLHLTFFLAYASSPSLLIGLPVSTPDLSLVITLLNSQLLVHAELCIFIARMASESVANI